MNIVLSWIPFCNFAALHTLGAVGKLIVEIR